MKLLLISFTAFFLASCALNPVTGKQELSPAAFNLILAVASSEAHALAADYLQSGHVDYKKDLISGALSQVRTIEGTANPVTTGLVSQAVGNVITDPNLQAAVTTATVKTVNEALSKGLTTSSAVETSVALLDTILSHYSKP